MSRRRLPLTCASLLTTLLACGPDDELSSGASAATTEGDAETDASATTRSDGSDGSDGSASEATTAETTGASETTGGETTGDGTTGEETTGELDLCQDGGPCTPVVVMGYWPPTNEMLRPWSQNPAQNLGAWEGKNWEGRGYDIFAFFPEFPPDGDPSNDPIGAPGSVGADGSDLQVDYQDTSRDFWRIVEEHEPVALVTTSRGGVIGWEVEALEGGHQNPDLPDGPPELDWISDQYGAETFPSESSVDPRTWDAISSYRHGVTLETQLPADAIVEAVSQLGLVSAQLDYGTSGRYLSGFLGLHGLYYNSVTPGNLVAGHIHVGKDVSSVDARVMIEATMRVVLSSLDRARDGG